VVSELLKKRLEPPENKAALSLETERARLETVKLPGSIPTLASITLSLHRPYSGRTLQEHR